MLYLIAIYCMIFIYLIFLLTVKETMRRFYKECNFVEEDDEERRRKQLAPNRNEYLPALCWKRHQSDMQAALAYSFLVMTDGRVGSAIEREFILEERNRIKFRSMGRLIETQTYDESSDEERNEKLLEDV